MPYFQSLPPDTPQTSPETEDLSLQESREAHGSSSQGLSPSVLHFLALTRLAAFEDKASKRTTGSRPQVAYDAAQIFH